MKSPQILELSGIGRRDVLSNINVDAKVDLPGVGENVQEHSLVGMTYELNADTHETYDLMRDPEYAARALKLQCVKLFWDRRNANLSFSAARARV
jgi:choline dehydrogenase-like flavoprotein